MEPRTLQYLVMAAQGQCSNGPPETVVRGVCTDSRQVQAHDLFVALEGDRFDGHAYIAEAATKGAAGALVAQGKIPAPLPNCAIVAVDSTRLAFGRMAARYRQDFRVPIIAVAGSNGKTTTKELLAAVLQQKFRTLFSRASFNNDIGVPTTLLELGRQHEAAVLEFGTNHPGELAALLQLAKPQMGVLTSIGREHLEFFGDLEGVIQEEGAIAEALPSDGCLFLNGDTPGAERIAARCRANVVRVGFAAANAWRATAIQLHDQGSRFRVEAAPDSFQREFSIPLLGRHQVINALLAIAVGAELGVSADAVQHGLQQCAPAKMRLQSLMINGVHLLDDSYNANADSMRAALDTLREFPCPGRRIAVLGDMAELGVHASAAHAEIGGYAAESKIDCLIAVGRMASVMATAARQGGLKAVQEATSVEEAATMMGAFMQAGDLILLKASRATHLERLIEMLRESASAQPNNDVSQGFRVGGAA